MMMRFMGESVTEEEIEVSIAMTVTEEEKEVSIVMTVTE